MWYIEQEVDSIQPKKGAERVNQTSIRVLSCLMTERRQMPLHFDRLRWGGGSGAVEAKCRGCERRLLFGWRWQGGRAGTAGFSSQESGGVLSAPLRTQKGHVSRHASNDGLA